MLDLTISKFTSLLKKLQFMRMYFEITVIPEGLKQLLFITSAMAHITYVGRSRLTWEVNL